MTATFDYELYSEAGHTWTDPTPAKPLGHWSALPGAAQGKKGLSVVGSAAYMEHLSTEVLTLSYDLEDDLGVRRWQPGQPPPVDLWLHVLSGGELEAHNSLFDWMAWNVVCVRRYDWPTYPLVQMHCSMATARVNNLPGALDNLGAVLWLDVQKDAEGKRLIRKFCIPRNPTKTDPRRRILPSDDPEDFERLCAYCDRDVASERAASHHPLMVPMSTAEREAWLIDQQMNWRGLAIDRPAVRDCIAVLDAAMARYGQELRDMTGGISPSEILQLTGWLHGQGVHMHSLDADSVAAMLATPDEGIEPHVTVEVMNDAAGTFYPHVHPGRSGLPPLARRALEIRQLVGSASVKKLYAMENQACADDRLRNLITHHGARTGRPTGEGPQPLNLPKDGPKLVVCVGCAQPYRQAADACPWCQLPAMPGAKGKWSWQYVDSVLLIMAGRSLEMVEWFFGDALLTISGCVRGLFVAGPGKRLIASDYSSIEAVVAAMLSGEQWRIDAFRNNEPIYLVGASKITGTSVAEYLDYYEAHGDHHPDRQKIGKVSELACFSRHTQVLTDNGYKDIVAVAENDKLWDGVEWVRHQGVIAKGIAETTRLDGVGVTPSHLINSNGFWMEASQLVSSQSMLRSALATGSANLPLCALSTARTSRRNAVALSCRKLRRRIYERVNQVVVAFVQSKRVDQRAKGSGVTPTLCPMSNIDGACSTGYRPALRGASRTGTQITEHEVFGSLNRGGMALRVDENISPMWSCLKGGTSRILNWIASTWTAITNRAIFALSQKKPTHRISGLFKRCSSESTIWSDVYDIVNAGPRQRFTIKTNSGHLLVHNCAYGGWVGSYLAFGSTEPETVIKQQISAWRAASPAIVECWGGQWRGKPWDGYAELYGYEGMFVAACREPGRVFEYRGIRFEVRDIRLVITLLSGREIIYHEPELAPATRPYAPPGSVELSYMTWNRNPKYGAMGWVRMKTYGGRLFENVDQAIAHDIQRYGLKLCADAGYDEVLGVYDEDVFEVDEQVGSVEEVERLMSTMPPWAIGDDGQPWPIRAHGGWAGRRFRKG